MRALYRHGPIRDALVGDGVFIAVGPRPQSPDVLGARPMRFDALGGRGKVLARVLHPDGLRVPAPRNAPNGSAG